MVNLAGTVAVKGSFVEFLAAQVQYPVCSCFILENRTEQSLLLFPKAGNRLTGNECAVGVDVVDVGDVVVAKDRNREFICKCCFILLFKKKERDALEDKNIALENKVSLFMLIYSFR